MQVSASCVWVGIGMIIGHGVNYKFKLFNYFIVRGCDADGGLFCVCIV